MSRPRKLTSEQVEAAASDRRGGMSWNRLARKYKCAVNTVRTALAEYSTEFLPNQNPRRAPRAAQLRTAVNDIEKIKKALKKRFNLHI